MNLGESIKVRRESLGMKQEDLAKESGVPIGTIQGIEQGRRPDPQFSTVQALAAALGCTCHELTLPPAKK